MSLLPVNGKTVSIILNASTQKPTFGVNNLLNNSMILGFFENRNATLSDGSVRNTSNMYLTLKGVGGNNILIDALPAQQLDLTSVGNILLYQIKETIYWEGSFLQIDTPAANSFKEIYFIYADKYEPIPYPQNLPTTLKK